VANSKSVGILGGMGPFATVAFFEKLVALTPARKDWEHIRTIIDCNPHIPSRTRHLLFKEASPVPAMIESCRMLANYPVDFIALPCNSASCFIGEVAPSVDVPLMNIIDETASALKSSGAGSCAVIGGYVTYTTRAYEKPLARHGIKYLAHQEKLQREVEKIIENIKLLDVEKETEKRCYEILKEVKKTTSADAVILGCTEFGCIYPFKQRPDFLDFLIVDSSTELARAVIKEAKGASR
jgi:aspartate racemase